MIQTFDLSFGWIILRNTNKPNDIIWVRQDGTVSIMFIHDGDQIMTPTMDIQKYEDLDWQPVTDSYHKLIFKTIELL